MNDKDGSDKLHEQAVLGDRITSNDASESLPSPLHTPLGHAAGQHSWA